MPKSYWKTSRQSNTILIGCFGHCRSSSCTKKKRVTLTNVNYEGCTHDFFFASLYVLLLLMTEIQIMTIIHVSNIFITTFLNYSDWLLKVLVFLLYEFLKVSYVMLYQPLQKVLVKQHMRIANIELLYDCMLASLIRRQRHFLCSTLCTFLFGSNYNFTKPKTSKAYKDKHKLISVIMNGLNVNSKCKTVGWRTVMNPRCGRLHCT